MREVSKEELEANMDRAVKRPAVQSDLVEYDTKSPSQQQVYDLLWLDKSSIGAFAAQGHLISDDHPFTEFFLWRYVRTKLTSQSPE